jgi:hypothetical protein
LDEVVNKTSVSHNVSDSAILEDFKLAKDIIEGEVLAYKTIIPTDSIGKLHRDACENALSAISKHYH